MSDTIDLGGIKPRKVFPELCDLAVNTAIPLSKPVGISFAMDMFTMRLKDILNKSSKLYKEGRLRWDETEEMLALPVEMMVRFLNSEHEWMAKIARWRLAGEPNLEIYEDGRIDRHY